MCRVAIVGKGSYIGNSIALTLREKGLHVVEVDAIESRWVDFDFSSVDTIVHVAAIVHRKDITDPEIYNKVNVELPVEVAKRAQAAGVKQFVFMSSMAVYGKSHTLTDCCIEPNSPLNPKTEYGKSKLRAEIELQKVMDGSMLLSIIRPPSVYGYGCRGNLFKRYEKIAMLMPWIPKCEMSCLQGLLFIDNLCNVVHALIKGRREGTYHPQDRKLLSTSEILREIRIQKGKNCRVSRYLGKVISLCSFFSIYSKLFGAVSYSELFSQRELLECAMLTTHDGLRKMYRSEK